MEYRYVKWIEAIFFHSTLKNKEKQIMMVVQANPNTHPGGVHGALFKF